MFHLRGADALGHRPESAVGGGVGIAADHGHARQGGARFRPHDMDNALAPVVDLELGDAKVPAVVIQGLHLLAGQGIADAVHAAAALAGFRGDIVFRRRQVGIPPPGLATGQTQTLEGLRRSHLVNQVAVDVDQRRTVVALVHQMGIPELVIECLACHLRSLESVSLSLSLLD